MDLKLLKGITLDDLVNLHDSEKLVEVLKPLAEKYRDQASLHMMISKINCLKGNITEACRGYEHVIEIEPDNAVAYHEMGICQFNNANFLEAIFSFKKALSLDDNLKMAAYFLGRCYFNELKHEGIIEVYSKLIKKYPEWTLVGSHLGLAYEATGNLDQATQCLESVVKRTKSNLIAYYHLANLYFKKRELQRAIETARKGLSINPESKELKKLLEYFMDT